MYKVIQKADWFEIRRTNAHILINQILSLVFIYYFGSQLLGNVASKDYFWAVVNGLLLLFILRGFFIQLNQLLKNKPVLRIDTEGVHSQLDGFIPKADITNIQLSEIEKGKQRLFIFIKNPDDYLSRASGLKKALLERLYKQAGTPLVIRLRGTFDRDKLSEFLAQY